MDQDRETQRRTYQLCRLGFTILSAALGLACLTSLLGLALPFLGFRDLARAIFSSKLFLWIDAPIVWGCLIGAYLLWGRWTQASWQRRAGLLVLMGLVDIVLWLFKNGEMIGLRLDEVGHEWFRSHLGEALGWAEFALTASLAGDLLAHLGVAQAPEAARSTRSLAATGAVVWMLLFVQETDWKKGWPLQGAHDLNIEGFLLSLGWNLIWTIALIQTTALTITAARQTGRALAEMDEEDREDDLFGSPSDTGADLLPTPYDPYDPRNVR